MFITHQQNLMAFWDSARETLAEGIFYTKRQIKIQILRHRIRGYQADIDVRSLRRYKSFGGGWHKNQII
eukprot:g78167.t1